MGYQWATHGLSIRRTPMGTHGLTIATPINHPKTLFAFFTGMNQNPMGNPWDDHRLDMGCPWPAHGMPIGYPWATHEKVMGCSWATPMGYPWATRGL